MYRFSTGMGLAVLLASVISVLAQDVAEEDSSSFKSSLNLGMTMTDGNSETMQANASLTTEGKREGLGLLRGGFESNYGESTVDDKTEKTVEDYRLYGKANRDVSEMTYWSLNGEALRDDIAEVDYRIRVGTGIGRYLVRNDEANLSMELGPTYIWEEVAGQTDEYMTLRLGERFEYQITKTSKIWQSIEYLPRVDDFSDYLVNAEVGVEAAINSSVNLRVVLKDDYDSQPGSGLEKNDITVIAGIGVNI